MIKSINSEGFELKDGTFFPFHFDLDPAIDLDLLNKFWADWSKVIEEVVSNER